MANQAAPYLGIYRVLTGIQTTPYNGETSGPGGRTDDDTIESPYDLDLLFPGKYEYVGPSTKLAPVASTPLSLTSLASQLTGKVSEEEIDSLAELNAIVGASLATDDSVAAAIAAAGGGGTEVITKILTQDKVAFESTSLVTLFPNVVLSPGTWFWEMYLKGRDFNYDRILVELAATEAAAIQFGRGYENYWQESGNNAFWAFNSYNSDGDSLTMGYYGGNSTDDHIHRLHGTFTNAAEATLTSKWAQQSAYNDTYIDAGSYMRLIKMD